MYSACRGVVAILVAITCSATAAVAVQHMKRTSAPARTAAAAPPRSARARRVCAGPNNLPFSNVRGEGLENALARFVAARLGWTVQYTWWPQRRGLIRNTLRAGRAMW